MAKVKTFKLKATEDDVRALTNSQNGMIFSDVMVKSAQKRLKKIVKSRKKSLSKTDLLQTLKPYISADDVNLSPEQFLEVVSDRIHEDRMKKAA